MSTGDEIRTEPSRAELATAASSPEVADLRAQLAELADRLLTERWAHYECHREYDDVLSQCGAWSERCAQLEAEQKAAVRLVGEWAARAGEMEARCESREGALRECHALAEMDTRGEMCGEIVSIIDALMGEVAP